MLYQFFVLIATISVIFIGFALKFLLRIKSLKQKLTAKVEYVKPDLKNRFTKAKVPENLDYIVIGKSENKNY